MRNNNASGVDFRCWVCMVLVLTFILSCAACANEEVQEPLRATTVPVETTVSIETVYGPLKFPKELYDKLRHMEVTEGQIAVEVFYMICTQGEREAFRIYYADPGSNTCFGYLQTDSGEIPVSYRLCEYEDTEFENEEDRKLYYDMMSAFSVVMNSIHEDPRFSETRSVASVGNREVQLRYWTLTLPENIQCTETEENGEYLAVFYGEVSGDRIKLYTIGLGDMEAESVLGWYTADGVQKQVKVQTHSPDAYENWSEENQIVIYEMMNSLNSVIQIIVSDANFSDNQNAG